MRTKFVFPFVMKGKYKFVHSTLTALFLFLKVALERAIIKRYTDYYSMFDTSGISHTQKNKTDHSAGCRRSKHFTQPALKVSFIIVETVLPLNSPENSLTKTFSQVRFTLFKLQIPLNGVDNHLPNCHYQLS